MIEPLQILLASAGSGKTFRLALHMTKLLLAGALPREILAATFTRKAAGEIRTRILSRLAGAARDEEGLAALRRDAGDDGITLEQCRRVLQVVVAEISRLRVQTLDAWFAWVGRALAPEVGLDPGWRIGEEVEDRALQAEVLTRQLEALDLHAALALLQSLQGGRPRPRVLEAALASVAEARALARWAEPDALAFLARSLTSIGPISSEEAEEWARRAEAIQGPNTKKGQPDKRIVDALQDLAEAIRGQDWSGLLGKGLFSKWLHAEPYYRWPVRDSAEAHALFSEMQPRLAEPLARQIHAQNLSIKALLESFEGDMREAQSERGLLRFDDLTQRLAEAASALNGELLAFRLDGKLKHVLLDEYQDTNAQQHAVLDRLLQEIVDNARNPGGEHPSHSFFAVGDAKQSIYGFRQAEPRLLEGMPQRYRIKAKPLSTNYRSAKVVLDFVNRLFGAIQELSLDIEDNTLDQARARFLKTFEPHTAAPGKDLAGQVRVWRSGAPAKSTKSRDLSEEHIDTVINVIRQRLTECPAASIGILVRTNALGNKLLHRLAAEGIAAAGEGGLPLADSPAVRQALALLRLADHPGDGLALATVLQSRLGSFLKLDLAEEDLQGLGAQIGSRVRESLAEEGLGPYLQRLRNEAEGLLEFDFDRLEAMIALGNAWPMSPAGRHSEFVAHVAQARMRIPSGTGVRVLTIHAAKGLEYDAVVLPQFAEPLSKASSLIAHRQDPFGKLERLSVRGDKDLQALIPELGQLALADEVDRRTDSLCQLYVAVTRAKRSLDIVLPTPPKNQSLNTMDALVSKLLGLSDEDDPGRPAQLVLLQPGSREEWWVGIERSEPPKPSSLPETLTIRGCDKSRLQSPRSPSSVEGGTRRSPEQWLDPIQRGAADLGTLVHAVMEQVPWAEDLVGLDLAEVLLEQRALHGLGQESLDKAQAILAAALKAPEITQALQRRNPQDEAHCEWRFACVVDGVLWNGIMDRIVLHKDAGGRITSAEVLDWKSDQVEQASLPAKSEHYRPQLESYARVLQAQFGLPEGKVSMRLAFLRPGRVVELGAI